MFWFCFLFFPTTNSWEECIEISPSLYRRTKVWSSLSIVWGMYILYTSSPPLLLFVWLHVPFVCLYVCLDACLQACLYLLYINVARWNWNRQKGDGIKKSRDRDRETELRTEKQRRKKQRKAETDENRIRISDTQYMCSLTLSWVVWTQRHAEVFRSVIVCIHLVLQCFNSIESYL